jgi:hypothetical protein
MKEKEEEMWEGRKLLKAKLSVFTNFMHRPTPPVETIHSVRYSTKCAHAQNYVVVKWEWK